MTEDSEINEKKIGPVIAIVAGQLIVNIPILIIFLLVRIGGAYLFPGISSWLLLGAGFLLGWMWWSYTLPLWQAWIKRVGTSSEAIEKLAAWTLLTWPGSHPIKNTGAGEYKEVTKILDGEDE